MRKLPEQKIDQITKEIIRQDNRIGQAARFDKHWIVLNISPERSPEYHRPYQPYRYPSLETAIEAVEVISSKPKNAGKIFGIFEFTGISRQTIAGTNDE